MIKRKKEAEVKLGLFLFLPFFSKGGTQKVHIPFLMELSSPLNSWLCYVFLMNLNPAWIKYLLCLNIGKVELG